jgi:tetratricopeptide (TPR) repeat protein
LLMAAGPRAEIHFALADVLYRAGDLSAARERYYAALELDDEYVEARATLGCVLAEMGEVELAAATFAGALAMHPDFADVHFHLANTLERLDRHDEAEAHFRTFLELAPESPWAEAARDRLAVAAPPRIAPAVEGYSSTALGQVTLSGLKGRAAIAQVEVLGNPERKDA